MKLVTLLCGLFLITTGTWAYSRDCAKGPDYWCRDAATAKDCGAVSHCEQTVWRENQSNKKTMTTHTTAQMLCNVLVHASTELLAHKSVDTTSIQNYLRADCRKLPAENNVVQQCEMAVDLYLSDILRHIQSGTEATKICSIIQGHDTPSVVVPKPEPFGITPNQTCVLCEFVIHLLQTFASANSTAQELSQILENICQVMPSGLRTECKSFIDQYGPSIVAILVEEFDPAKTCTLVKLCPKSQNVAFLTKPNVQICGLCDYVSTYLSAGYSSENVCSYFSTDENIKQKCQTLVHLFKPNFCTQLPICADDLQLQPVKQSIDVEVNSLECSLCKYIVSYVDAVVQTNKTEAAIEAALEKVCTILPLALNETCFQFVQAYGPILVQLIEKYGTPGQVCDALRLCQNGTVELVPVDQTPKENVGKVSLKTLECSLCKYAIGYLEKTLGNNRSAAAVEAALEKVCGALPPSVKGNCTHFVDTYGPIIAILFARNASAEQICDFIKVCRNGTESAMSHAATPLSKIQKATVDSTQCSLCKYVVSYVDAVVQTNKTEAAIEAAMDKVCSILPAALNETCFQFVQSYGPILVQLIEKYGTPGQVCNALKLCKNGTEEMKPRELLPTLKIKETSVNTLECSLCKYVVGYIDAVIQNNKSEAAIEAALEKVCTILPAALNTSCYNFVESYGPILVQLIEKFGTPDQVCVALKACPKETPKLTSRNLLYTMKTKDVSVNSLECSLCKYVVGYIDAVIQNNKSEAAIEAALEKVCTILPAALNTSCYNFIKLYGPILVQLIEKFGTPDQVCVALKACPKETEKVAAMPHQVVKVVKRAKSGTECTLCKYILSYVNLLIDNNATEEGFEKALEDVCSILPSDYHKKCLAFAQEYGPILVQLIAELDDPNAVCEWLSLCPKSSTEFIPIPALKTNKLQSLPCNLCQYVVNYLDAIMESNSTETKVEEALDDACKILPGATLQSECQSLVHLYSADLIKLLVEHGDPKAVCQAIGICDK